MTNRDPLKDIASIAENLKYGWTTFTVRVHGGKITDVVGHSFKNKRYKQQNKLALVEIGGYLAEHMKNEDSGSYSFTVVLDKGNIKKLTLQEGVRTSYRWTKG